MIDVQIYIDKLNKLREYIFIGIDSFGKGFWINIEAIPRITADEFLRLYAEAGILFFNGNTHTPEVKKLSFNEWLNTNPKA